MAGRLENKVAIITGATSGIGRAVAVLFVREGARVVVAGSLEQNGLDLERKLKALGADALYVRTDVTKTEDLQYLVSTAIAKYGQIDVLVNNAGAVSPSAPGGYDEIRDYEEIFNINIKSYLVLCREVLPHMTRLQKGSIINTSYVGAEMGAGGIASYAAGKGAINAFTRSLAREYADQGIRVNSVMPGLTLADTAPGGIDISSIAASTVPMGRAAQPEEIAYGFLFFASDESSFCTGSNLVIDGGATTM
ncbi:MAG: SDR family oxidoreductase [Clostridiales bacterium]|nr:SDR family oxidoreductase [Clostridiales bacterium]